MSRRSTAGFDASAVRVRVPFRRAFVTGAGTFRERDAWLVRLRDADGREGVGEASLDPGAGPALLLALADAVRAAVLAGGAPRDDGPSDAVTLAVRSAFAGAAADLALHGTPAAAGFVPVNATIASAALDDTLDAAEAALVAGFDCLKLKCGVEHTTEGLVERLTLVRALAGDDIEIRLDANGAWDPATAAERLGAVGHLGISYVEQPVAAGDLATMAWLRRVAPLDIAADESVGSRADADAVLAAEAADVLVVKPARVGGRGETAAVAAAAAAHGVGVTVSTLLETGVGLAAAIRAAATLPGGNAAWAHGLATSDLLVSDLLATPLAVHDGRVAIPAEPIVLDEAALARSTVDRVDGTRR